MFNNISHLIPKEKLEVRIFSEVRNENYYFFYLYELYWLYKVMEKNDNYSSDFLQTLENLF